MFATRFAVGVGPGVVGAGGSRSSHTPSVVGTCAGSNQIKTQRAVVARAAVCRLPTAGCAVSGASHGPMFARLRGQQRNTHRGRVLSVTTSAMDGGLPKENNVDSTSRVDANTEPSQQRSVWYGRGAAFPKRRVPPPRSQPRTLTSTHPKEVHYW
jgi:hypothetical protein